MFSSNPIKPRDFQAFSSNLWNSAATTATSR